MSSSRNYWVKSELYDDKYYEDKKYDDMYYDDSSSSSDIIPLFWLYYDVTAHQVLTMTTLALITAVHYCVASHDQLLSLHYI